MICWQTDIPIISYQNLSNVCRKSTKNLPNSCRYMLLFNTCSQCITRKSCAKVKRLSDTLRYYNDSKIPRFQKWRGVLDAFVVLSKFRDGKEGKTGETGKTAKAKSIKPPRHGGHSRRPRNQQSPDPGQITASRLTCPIKRQRGAQETGRNKDSKTIGY